MKIYPKDLNRRDSHRLLLSSLIPRPIALVSTISDKGVLNAAPFSFYGGISSSPPLIGISISKRRGEKKDTLKNIEYTGDFVVNIVTEEIAESMNITSGDYPSEVDEFKKAGFTPSSSEMISSPRISESPINFECRVFEKLVIRNSENTFIIGEILLFHINDDLWSDGAVDASKLKAIGRLGTDKYCTVRDIFEMIRPKV